MSAPSPLPSPLPSPPSPPRRGFDLAARDHFERRFSDESGDLPLFRVLRDDGSAPAPYERTFPAETLLLAYREMRRLRLIDARMIALQRQGRVGFYGACTGQEAVPIAAGLALAPDDWVFPALREQAVMLVRGFSLVSFIAQLFGNSGDILKGRQMPSHHSSRSVNQVAWSSCIGPQLPQAVGAAWAMKLAQAGAHSKSASLAFCGDGATSQPDFHHALTFAGRYRVPCVVVCQNNQFAISVPAARQTASRSFAVKGRAYGVPSVRVDGNDFLAMHEALEAALARARAGEGASFIEAVTYRIGPHSSSDDPARYRAESEVEAWRQKDPLERLRAHLVHRGLVTESTDAPLDGELRAEVDAALREAEALPPPPLSSLFDDVYAEVPWHLQEQRRALLGRHAGRPRPGE